MGERPEGGRVILAVDRRKDADGAPQRLHRRVGIALRNGELTGIEVGRPENS